jgi:hypothetical protein
MTIKIDKVLDHKNWTGLSLAELVWAHRISPADYKTIWSFVTAALGEPQNMASWANMKDIQREVIKALESKINL